MAARGDAVPAGSVYKLGYGVGTLPALAGPHAATGQKLDLVNVTVTIGDGFTYLSGRDFLATADDGVIVRYTEQFAGYMKKGIEERPDMQFFAHPFSIVTGQTVTFTPVYLP